MIVGISAYRKIVLLRRKGIQTLEGVRMERWQTASVRLCWNAGDSEQPEGETKRTGGEKRGKKMSSFRLGRARRLYSGVPPPSPHTHTRGGRVPLRVFRLAKGGRFPLVNPFGALPKVM